MSLPGLLERLWERTPAGRTHERDRIESRAAPAEASTAEAEAEARVAALVRCQDELLDALERAMRAGERAPAWALDVADATRAYMAAKRLWGADDPKTLGAARAMLDAFDAAEATEAREAGC
jgi:hypothetical protein